MKPHIPNLAGKGPRGVPRESKKKVLFSLARSSLPEGADSGNSLPECEGSSNKL